MVKCKLLINLGNKTHCYKVVCDFIYDRANV